MELTRRLIEQGVQIQALCLGGVIIDGNHAKQSKKFKLSDKLMPKKKVVKLLTSAGLSDLEGGFSDEEWDEISAKYNQDMLLSQWTNQQFFVQQDGKKLDIPLYCVVSKDDPLTKSYRRKVKHWQQVAEHVNLIDVEHGGHYFIKTNSDTVAREVDGIFAEIN